jgi:hypothetical protein
VQPARNGPTPIPWAALVDSCERCQLKAHEKSAPFKKEATSLVPFFVFRHDGQDALRPFLNEIEALAKCVVFELEVEYAT